jgi:hypothetical protein
VAPLVERWNETYGARGIKFFKVMVAENDLIALDFLKHFRGTFPHTIDFDKKMTVSFNATSFPNAVVIDANGMVVAHEFVWKKGIEKLEQALDAVASKEEPEAACPFATPDCKTFCTGGVCYAPPDEKKGKASVRQEFPRMAALPDGSVWVAYTSNKTGDANIFLERYKNGKMKKRYQVTATPSDEYDADCATAADGTLWLAWTSNTDSLYDIYAASFKDGRLSQPMRVTTSAHDAFHPRIAVDGAGVPWITYYKWLTIEDSSKDRNIYARRYAGGAWSGEIEVSPPEPASEDHSDPDIAVVGNEVLVAWSYDYHPSLPGNTLDAASPTIFLQGLTPSAERAGAPQLMGSTGANARIKDLSPSIAADGAAAACAWDANKEIAIRRWENGAWSALEKISRGEEPCNAPAVAVAPGGTYVAYSQIVDGRWRIVGRANVGGVWEDQVFLDKGAGNARFPAVAADSDGTVWVAYAEQAKGGVSLRMRKW